MQKANYCTSKGSFRTWHFLPILWEICCYQIYVRLGFGKFCGLFYSLWLVLGLEFSDRIPGFQIQITEIRYIELGFGSDLNYFGSKSIQSGQLTCLSLRMQNEISGETHWMQNINYPFEYQYFTQNKILIDIATPFVLGFWI